MKRMKLNPLSAFLLFALLSQVECTSQNRTIMEDHSHTNALIDETSPYLLQHAHNPVNWYPWGEEALQKAQKEDICRPDICAASLREMCSE